jgi:DNA polymerase-3 subunit gamma/tau
VPFAPTSGTFRVYIIDEVHMLTTEAFNALLKTLEEPPAHAKFIFATTAVNKVPVTILSRCQRFDFRRIEPGTMVEALQHLAKAEKLKIDEPALYAVARSSEGSMRDAEVVLEQLASFVDGPIKESDVSALLGAMESEALFAWAQAILERNAPEALRILLGQLDHGKDVPQLLAGLLRHLRNLLVVCSTRQAASRETLLARLIDEPSERITRLESQAALTSSQELLLLLQIVSGAYELVRRSPMAQTILELVVMKLATREEWQSLEQISQTLDALQAGAPSGAPSSPPAPAAASPKRTAQPEAPPVKSPTPPVAAAAAVPVPAGLREGWPVFLERLGAQKMSLAAYLADAKPMQVEGKTVTIGLPAFALHQEVLTVLENRRLIERLLSDLLQTPVVVQYATLPEPSPEEASEAVEAADDAAPSIVQDIVKLFNATVMNQPPTAT